jgi:alpha/beta superfamily hydrolase
LEQITLKENFWKNKDLVKKTVKQKKIFEDILNSYKKSNNDLNNLKDLYILASQEKDEETIQDCTKKIIQILQDIKKSEINCFLSGENDELVTKESIDELDNRIKNQKGVEVIFSKIKSSNHFFKNKEKELKAEIEKYLKEKTALI